jgi:hypothetical protein
MLSKMQVHFFLLLIFLFCDCKSISEACNPIKTSGSILPLAIGNKWIYRANTIDEHGIIANTSYVTIQILSDTIVNGETWYDFPVFGYCANRSDGLWVLDHQQTQDHKDTIITQLLWKYPANAKDTTNLGALYSTDNLISVPYGCYLANEYIFLPYSVGPSYPNPYRWFMVPGVGMLREEQAGINTRQFDLVSVVLH